MRKFLYGKPDFYNAAKDSIKPSPSVEPEPPMETPSPVEPAKPLLPVLPPKRRSRKVKMNHG